MDRSRAMDIRGAGAFEPIQGDEKRLPIGSYFPWKRRPLFVISTGGIMGLWPTQGEKNGSCSASTLSGSTDLPFVISTEAYPDFLPRAASDDHVCGSP
jgi:hypothetical protein